MKKITLIRPLALVTGSLLVLPSMYFIVSAWLNYGMGFPALWKVIEPIFENPENKSFGFNINLLILFGPLVALLVNLPQVMNLDMLGGKDELHLQVVVKKFSWSWLVITASIFCLSALCLYLFVENCNC